MRLNHVFVNLLQKSLAETETFFFFFANCIYLNLYRFRNLSQNTYSPQTEDTRRKQQVSSMLPFMVIFLFISKLTHLSPFTFPTPLISCRAANSHLGPMVTYFPVKSEHHPNARGKEPHAPPAFAGGEWGSLPLTSPIYINVPLMYRGYLSLNFSFVV